MGDGVGSRGASAAGECAPGFQKQEGRMGNEASFPNPNPGIRGVQANQRSSSPPSFVRPRRRGINVTRALRKANCPPTSTLQLGMQEGAPSSAFGDGVNFNREVAL